MVYSNMLSALYLILFHWDNMTTELLQLTPSESDQLKELLNIGVSHAGDTLSVMLGHRVTISVPELIVSTPQTQVPSFSDSEEVMIAILLRLTGGLDGYVFLFFPHHAAVHLLHALSEKTIGDLRALNKFDKSVFQEIGNVLTGGMLTGLSKFLHVPILQSVPDVVVDMGSAMFNSISASMIAKHDAFLMLDVAICVDAPAHAISCTPGEESVGKMFLLLGPEATKEALRVIRPMATP